MKLRTKLIAAAIGLSAAGLAGAQLIYGNTFPYWNVTGALTAGTLAVTGATTQTGVATFTAQPIFSTLTASQAIFTDGSKGAVSNAVTGTGSVVMSASPTLTGTVTTAALSGTTLTGSTQVTAPIVTTSGFLQFPAIRTVTGDASVAVTDTWIIANKAGTVALTLPDATTAANTGRMICVKTSQAQTVTSASSNVVPLITAGAGTAILAGTAGKWACMVSDATNWVIMAAN